MKFSKDKDTPISAVVSFTVGEHAWIQKFNSSNVAVTCVSFLLMFWRKWVQISARRTVIWLRIVTIFLSSSLKLPRQYFLLNQRSFPSLPSQFIIHSHHMTPEGELMRVSLNQEQHSAESQCRDKSKFSHCTNRVGACPTTWSGFLQNRTVPQLVKNFKVKYE